MSETEPVRLRHDPESPPELRRALRDLPEETPTDAVLGELRLALAAKVGEPQRLRNEPELGRVMRPARGSAPTSEQLRALRARLPEAPRRAQSTVRRFKPKRKVATVLAWLLPAAAAAMSGAYYAVQQSREEAPIAPVTSAPTAFETVPPPIVSAPAVAPSAEEPAVPSASASAVKRAPVPSVGRNDPEAELRLIREAQAALAANPAQSLSLASEHAREFPRGVLAPEREVVSIDALNRLGRVTEARARAERFRRSHPGSAYLPRIDRLVGAAPSPAESAKPANSGAR
jgi:hypothetical protein